MRLPDSPEARLGFEAAERCYERQMPGLGAGFREEILIAVGRLRQWPLAFPVERGDIRRLAIGRFPHKLLYSIEADCIYLVAVAHQHRKPDYWVDRRSSP